MRSAVALALLSLTGVGSVSASAHSGVVPWIPGQPPKFRVRALAPPCRAVDLRIGLFLSPVSGGGGLQGGIKVKHRATPRCSLQGTPSIRFAGGTRQRLTRGRLRTEGDRDGTLPRSALRSLGRGDEAYSAILWSNWCARKPRGVEVDLPQRGGRIVLGFVKVPSCSSSSDAAILKVSAFTPIEPQPALLPLEILASEAAAAGRESRAPVSLPRSAHECLSTELSLQPLPGLHAGGPLVAHEQVGRANPQLPAGRSPASLGERDVRNGDRHTGRRKRGVDQRRLGAPRRAQRSGRDEHHRASLAPGHVQSSTTWPSGSVT